MQKLPNTIGELRQSGYKLKSVKNEVRDNLIAKLKSGEDLFPDIVGFDDSVIPQITNALLSGQDLILLGERGQAKSRIVRSLVSFLDEQIPILADAEIPESPFAPITAQGRSIVNRRGDRAKIKWITPEERYAEKLATPDITIADLIGEIDPIKVAEGRYLSDELTIHYGLVPRVNLGVFAINELPDLTERIQVGLLNVLEERDVQIRGYRVRLPLDVLLVATANPEDYTNRGRIITPLKDRFGAQVRTHYPQTIEQEVTIIEQESNELSSSGLTMAVPQHMKEVIAEITHAARTATDVNQRSGVSVRASVGNYETILANALRRALRLNESHVVPRMSDLPYVVGPLQGKLEFEAFDEGEEDKITQRLIREAIKSVFGRYFDLEQLQSIVDTFEDGRAVEVGENQPTSSYADIVTEIPGMLEATESLNCESFMQASVVEFILEGLHSNGLLNKQSIENRAVFSG